MAAEEARDVSLKSTLYKVGERRIEALGAAYPKDPLLFGDLIQVCYQEGAA